MKRLVILFLAAALAACGSDAPDDSDSPSPFEIDQDKRLEEDSLWWEQSERLYAASPAVGPGGEIYFGGWDGKFRALDTDGEELWALQTGDKIDSAPAVSGDGTVFVGSWDGNLYALDAEGEEVWTLDTGAPVDLSPSVDADGRVYVGSESGTFYRLLADGSIDWEIELSAAPTTAASIYDDGTELTVFIGTADNALHCISEGTIQSTASLSAHAVDDVALDAQGNAYVGTTDGHAVKIDADCEILWDENLTWARLTSPTLDAGGSIYTGGLNEQIYSVSAEDGSRIWAEATSQRAPLLDPPTVGAGDHLYGGANSLISISRSGTVEALMRLDILPAPLITPGGEVYATTERGHLVRLDIELDALADTDWPMKFGNPQRTGYLAP